MKVALLFSGETRSINTTWENISKNIISPISKYSQVDLYGVFPSVFSFRENKTVKNCDTDFLSKIQWKQLSIIEPKKFDDKLVKKFANKTRNEPLRTNGLLNMWHMWKEVNNLKIKHENNFKYDWVFRMRPDSWFDAQIENLKLLNNNNLYIPDHDDWGGINDRFALSSSKNMDIYNSLIDHCEKIFDMGNAFHVETFLKKHIDNHKISIKRINTNMHIHRENMISKIFKNKKPTP